MKKLTPLWFVKPPIDPEHKEYILLDFLKSLGKDLEPKNCYSTLGIISKLIKELNDFKEHKNGLVEKKSNQGKGKDTYKGFDYSKLTAIEKQDLESIIENSLETIYEYSEICLDILKEEEEKIKIFKVITPLKEERKKTKNSGIVIIRNMISDQIIPYIWQGSVKMKTPAEGDKEIFILKKILVKNPNFSFNYEHIYHEILEEAGIKNSSPELFVIEIYENFDEESEIYKFAKEKFVEEMSK